MLAIDIRSVNCALGYEADLAPPQLDKMLESLSG